MCLFETKGTIIAMSVTMDGRKTYIKLRPLIRPKLEPHEREAPIEIEVQRNVFRTLGVGLIVQVHGIMQIIAKKKKSRNGDVCAYQIIRTMAKQILPMAEAM